MRSRVVEGSDGRMSSDGFSYEARYEPLRGGGPIRYS